MDRARRGWRHMAGNATGERELLEQLFQPGFVLCNVRIHFAPGTFKIYIAYDGGATVAGARDIEHVQVILLYYTVQMHIDKVLSGRCAPMADHQRLHMRK